MTVARFRDTDGWFGLRVVCEHGAQAELLYPVRTHIENWEWHARRSPCHWVPMCPQYPWRKRGKDQDQGN